MVLPPERSDAVWTEGDAVGKSGGRCKRDWGGVGLMGKQNWTDRPHALCVWNTERMDKNMKEV